MISLARLLSAAIVVAVVHSSLAAAPEILTPPAGPAPRINGPSVFGLRPGSPFFYYIPVTGERPLTYSVDNLPKGLTLDGKTGILTGKIVTAGEYRMTFRAANHRGKAEKAFRIAVGGQIALTPPMGWNSWNCWGGAVSQDKVLSSAKALVATGLRDHGWRFVNIDDGWQATRGGRNNGIQPNSKFPDMARLGEQLHAQGLAFGIYSTPWRGTYEGHIGSSGDHADGSYDWIDAGNHNDFYRIGKDDDAWNTGRQANHKFGGTSFVSQDVEQWAAWGVDYLKYDWNPIDVAHTRTMADALAVSGRDIVYSLSNSTPFQDAAELTPLANVWRTTGDITDTWASVSGIGFDQDRWAPFQHPGHWNDPDMLVVGRVGWGHPHPTRLTPDEQYTHLSLWCLLSAPLLLGCDLAELDDFTLGLLTNDEVLAIDQDALGKQATRVSTEGNQLVYAKPLEDGSIAVGLFNTGNAAATVRVKFTDLKLTGTAQVRDLWRQKDEAPATGEYSATVAAHGVKLVRLAPAH